SGLNRTGAGSFGAKDGLFGSISFAGPARQGTPRGGAPSDPASPLFGGDLVAAVLGPTSLNRATIPAEQAPALVGGRLLPDVQSVDQVLGSASETNQGHVSAGSNPALVSAPDPVLPLFSTDHL